MNLTITKQTCEDIIFNGHYLKKLYFNDHLVWFKPGEHYYSEEYFTIESLENNNTITVTLGKIYPASLSYWAYSVDSGASWQTYTIPRNGTNGYNVTITLNSGGKALFKGGKTNNRLAYKCGLKFNSTKNCIIYGNIMSLTNNLPNSNWKDTSEATSTGIYSDMFESLCRDWTKLIDASNLVLPDYIMYKYDMMGSLGTCKLYGCFSNMFNGCTNLEAAPVLQADVLVSSCYFAMFFNCSKIDYIKCLASNLSASNALNYWVYGVKGNGTFEKTSGVTWPVASNSNSYAGKPALWILKNAS